MRISEQKLWVNIGDAEKSRSYTYDEAIEVLFKSRVSNLGIGVYIVLTTHSVSAEADASPF